MVALHDLTKKKLAEVDRIIYMHVDHFEPQHKDPSIMADRLDMVLQGLNKSLHPSLFLYPALGMKWVDGKPVVKHDTRSMTIMNYARKLYAAGCDIHYHIHHEWWTRSEVTRPEWVEVLDRGLATGSELLEYFIQRTTEIYKIYNLPTTNWGFIHGRWALNASDDRVCDLKDEIKILMRNGCVADFTMPAGRAQCTPATNGIYAIKPTAEPKCYDTGAVIGKGTKLIGDDTFLMVYPSSNYFYISLDNLILKPRGGYYKTAFENMYSSAPDDRSINVVQEWIMCSQVIDGTLIIKTHSHNMRKDFWFDERGKLVNNSPMLNDKQRERLLLLQEICGENSILYHYATARDVIRFVKWVDSGSNAKDYKWGTQEAR